MSEHWQHAELHNAPSVIYLLTVLGFAWVEPGYWSLRVDDVELALQPQVLNAGAYQLQLYVAGMSVLGGELLVDVKPRPR